MPSHSELNLTTVLFLSKILNTCSLYVSAFLVTSSGDNTGLNSVLPVGSPMVAVKSPIRKITVCPKSWNCLNLFSNTVCPRWRSGAVGSKPALIIKGLDDFNFFINKSSLIISSVPLLIILIGLSGIFLIYS